MQVTALCGRYTQSTAISILYNVRIDCIDITHFTETCAICRSDKKESYTTLIFI